MPWKNEWVPARLFMKRTDPNGKPVSVYHMYYDDMYDEGMLPHTYGLKSTSELEDDDVFDISDIANALDIKNPNASDEYIIQRGIEEGIITADKINLPEKEQE